MIEAQGVLGLHGLQHSNPVERVPLTEQTAVVQRLAKVKTYAFASVDYPGAAWSFALDTNEASTVGYFMFEPDADPPRPKASMVSGGVYRIISVPNSANSHAIGINASGSIVGLYENLNGKRLGFVQTAGVYSDVEFPGAEVTRAYGINDSGVIVGYYRDAMAHTHGFTYSAGRYQSFDCPGATDTYATDINAGGDIVGYYSDATTTRGFLLKGGVFSPLDFPLATITIAQGINDAGDIVGHYAAEGAAFQSFVFADGAFGIFAIAGAHGTQAAAITNDGRVTGWYADALGGNHGFIGQ